MRIVWLPPAELQEHPQQRALFRPIDGDEWLQFLADVEERGILQPLIISTRTGTPTVVDGHQRWRAGRALELDALPCIERSFADENEEVRYLVMNNVRRRQLSREELQNVIAYYLLHYTHWADRRIADEVGANHATVRSTRIALETTGEISQFDKLQGSDGKWRNRSPHTLPAQAVAVEETPRDPFGSAQGGDARGTIDTKLPKPFTPQRGIWEPTETYGTLERAARSILSVQVSSAREALVDEPADWPTPLRELLRDANARLTTILSPPSLSAGASGREKDLN